MTKEFEFWSTVIFFGLFIAAAISWITFAQFSMRPMEKKMKACGIPSGFQWDGVGVRIFSYAFAIVFPEKLALRLTRLMDVKLIRSYASKADWWRGFFFLTIIYTWTLNILITFVIEYSN